MTPDEIKFLIEDLKNKLNKCHIEYKKTCEWGGNDCLQGYMGGLKEFIQILEDRLQYGI